MMIKSLANLVFAGVAIVWALGTIAARAQDAETQASRKAGIVVRLLAVDLLAGAENVVVRSGDVSSDMIELPTHGLSDGVRVTGRELVVAAPPKDGKPGRVFVRTVLPDRGKRFLLLLIPIKETYGIRVVRLDDPAFRKGGICFFNLSPTTVGGLLGDIKFVTEQGKPLFVLPPDQKDLPYYQVSFFCKSGKGSRQFANTRWPYGAHSRSYVFFYVKQNSTRMSYRAVDEIVADS